MFDEHIKEIFNNNLKEFIRVISDLIKPKPELKGSLWAELYRVVSPEISSKPGPWDNSVVPFASQMIDACTDPLIEEVTIVGSAQVVKTEVLLNTCGYYIHYEPSPILFVYPTLDQARKFSKEKLYYMLRDSACFKDLVKIEKSRDRDNATLHKNYPGGSLDIVGANSPSGLAQLSKRIVILDDCDRFPVSAGDEGDPAELAEKRSTSFPNRKKIRVSTPTVKDHSRIMRYYKTSNQMKYKVPCPHCNHLQVLKWQNFKWDVEENKVDLFNVEQIHNPETVAYACESCGTLIEEKYKREMIQNGQWIAEYPERLHQGFWIWEAYSPFKTWSEIISDYARVKDNPEALKTFYNTSLALEFEDEQAEEADPAGLIYRCEDYLLKDEFISNKILFLTMGVDLQGDRLEAQIKGYAEGKESWVLHYEKIFGDPFKSEIWEQLDDLRERQFTREDGVKLKVSVTFIDAGDGNHTQVVYDYTRPRNQYNVWAIKGRGGMGLPAIVNKSRSGAKGKKTIFFNLGVDSLKAALYSRLKVEEPGPRYQHFTKAFCDVEYFRMLTAEKQVKEIKGYKVNIVWKKKSGQARNEALDTTVYCDAAVEYAFPDFARLRKKYDKVIEQIEESKMEVEEVVKKDRVRKQRKTGYSVGGWI